MKPKSSRRFEGVSRRDMLAGTAAAALVAAIPASLRASPKSAAVAPVGQRKTTGSLRRYMAASAPLPDGRILVVGGYDRPFAEGSSPKPLHSAVILDPRTGDMYEVASMRLPRARHAAVALDDGRIAVLGGVGIAPTASVEIYDPSKNAWEPAAPLAQPRYDHSAVRDGNFIYVLGGSAQAMLSTVERYEALATVAAKRGRND